MKAVFPARAGMSPRRAGRRTALICVPRASGDEPTARVSLSRSGLCSPRERG